jgi:hypothetical protein
MNDERAECFRLSHAFPKKENRRESLEIFSFINAEEIVSRKNFPHLESMLTSFGLIDKISSALFIIDCDQSCALHFGER